ncbi:MAG: septum formation protein Maf [Betaproteobacteria bacterium TMED156]|nr:MAG: septum formation protein Maf [Betaproteobacteria bacterium TMED156]
MYKIKKNKKIFLASSSPRRKTLLEQIAHNLGIEVIILQPDPDKNMEEIETPKNNESPTKYVKRIALNKAHAAIDWIKISRKSAHPILTADTTVSFKGKILGKPRDKKDAYSMLKLLSNNSHHVLTSVVVIDYCYEAKKSQIKRNTYQTTNSTTVWFGEISNSWLNRYIKSGEPLDKSGAYGIQGKGQEIIKKINGSYSSVMGLPLFETLGILKKL